MLWNLHGNIWKVKAQNITLDMRWLYGVFPYNRREIPKWINRLSNMWTESRVLHLRDLSNI